VHETGIGADIAAKKGRREFCWRLIVLNITNRGNFQAQAFSNRLLAKSELFTGIAQARSRGLCCLWVLSGFSIHSLQLLVRKFRVLVPLEPAPRSIRLSIVELSV